MLLVLLAIPLAASATSMRAQNIVDLVDLSERIMVGRVIDLRDGFDGRGMPYTEVTLEVTDSIRGANGATYTFRQFGLLEPKDLGDGRTSLAVSPDGWPRFRQDEDVMVFMYRPASQTGLQTTVGLLQGKFSIVDGKVVNGVDNLNVFHEVAVDESRLDPRERRLMADPGAMPADAFVGLVRRAVENRWTETGVMTHAQ
jgi:hypothetical protein